MFYKSFFRMIKYNVHEIFTIKRDEYDNKANDINKKGGKYIK